MPEKRRRRWPWVLVAVVLALLIPVALMVVPILTHQPQGSSGQVPSSEEWPLAVVGNSEDGRERSFAVLPATPGGGVDTSDLTTGDRLVISGAGYDTSQGIYVAICVIPPSPDEKPGPCIGGVPDQEQEDVAEGTVQWAPSNWINDDWAWRLFGARSFDDHATGTFTAYLEVGDPAGEGFDCRVDACGIFTRNDHTALNDRVQDLYVPVGFAG
jgi:hypothetical protein